MQTKKSSCTRNNRRKKNWLSKVEQVSAFSLRNLQRGAEVARGRTETVRFPRHS